jgi:hypothetical protein
MATPKKLQKFKQKLKSARLTGRKNTHAAILLPKHHSSPGGIGFFIEPSPELVVG